MFDVKKLEKLMKEIFTRDNENFSPELVAEELESRANEITRCLAIGNYCSVTHDNSVVIGNNQKSDKPNQLKIGNNDISVSRDITDEEFEEILQTFKKVREFLPNQK